MNRIIKRVNNKSPTYLRSGGYVKKKGKDVSKEKKCGFRQLVRGHSSISPVVFVKLDT